MKILILLLLITTTTFAQKEGQSFCKGDITGSYFPLEISKKKIYWYDTSYLETLKGEKTINGVVYQEFEQAWENSATDLVYLRQDGSKVMAYDACCTVETLRYDASQKAGQYLEEC